MWAPSRKKVPNGLSFCHTKRRMGARGRVHPSFGMTPTFGENNPWRQQSPILKSRCHTKRRMGTATHAHPSFSMIATQAIRDLFAWRSPCITFTFLFPEQRNTGSGDRIARCTGLSGSVGINVSVEPTLCTTSTVQSYNYVVHHWHALCTTDLRCEPWCTRGTCVHQMWGSPLTFFVGWQGTCRPLTSSLSSLIQVPSIWK